MNRFPKSVLEGASTDALQRLAAWLGVSPARPFTNEKQLRHALVLAICRAEKRIAKVAGREAPRDSEPELATS